MAFAPSVQGELALLWPIFAVGFVVFAVLYAGKASAARAGRHLGVAGIGLVLLAVAVGSFLLGYADMGWIFGVFGGLLVVLGLRGKSRG